MKKSSKRFLSIFLSILMIGSAFALPASAENDNGVFDITNPYESVDWNAWKSYKSQLHCHTTASDGYLTVKEVVQLSYDLGYDVLAITDHGTLNRGWNEEPQLVQLMRLIKYERTQLSDIIPLSDEEYASYINGTALKSDGTARENGMLDVPLGIEQNLATPKTDCHLTSYWAEYGQGCIGVYGDYETPSAGINKAGGVSMLSHVGEYVYPEKDSELHTGKLVDEYYVNKFARIFLDNTGSSLGMGINSATDCHTRCDRILYDQILAKTIPNGVVPWGFSFSDAHNYDAYDDAYTMNMMPELSLDAFRTSMENGTFFSIARYSYGYELDGIAEMPEGYEANVKLPTPEVTDIDVNEQDGTITVKGDNFNRIVWVSNGQVINREADITNGTATIDLDDYADTASTYVRFYITGDGGICYSQPFVILAEGDSFENVDVPETNDISTTLRKLVTFVDAIFFRFNIFIQLFKKVSLGYSDWKILSF